MTFFAPPASRLASAISSVPCRACLQPDRDPPMSIARLHAGPRMSQTVVHGQTVYLAGQVADQAKGKSVGEQTKEILSAIDRLLAEAGSDSEDPVRDHLSRGHWNLR